MRALGLRSGTWMLLLCSACLGGTSLAGDHPGDAAAEDAAAEDDAEADAEACIPDCEGRECGDDGCGGTCPPGCGEDEVCSVPPGECLPAGGWFDITLRRAPPDGSRLVFDSSRGVVLAAGTRDGGGFETWAFDGSPWREITTTAVPSNRYGMALAYDSRRGVVVMFGGTPSRGSTGPLLQETWEFDGTAWRQVITPESPPASSELSSYPMVYDSHRDVTVLFRTELGEDPSRLSRVWEYDGTSWTERIVPMTVLVWDQPVAFDSARGVVVAYSDRGETWEFDGTSWTSTGSPTVPSNPPGAAMAYDSHRGVSVLFGGKAVPAGPSPTYPSDDTWEYDGTTWTEMAGSVSPSPRGGHSMAFDERRGVTVLFGGDPSDDTWEYDGTAWAKADTPTSLPASAELAYDSFRNVVIGFHGGRPRPAEWGPTPGGRTWEHDGTSWTEVETPTSPTARNGGFAMTYDASRRVVVLFGGQGVPTYWGDTWEYDGSTWIEVGTAASPSPRVGSAMAFDSRRGVTVLFSGVSSSNDTWEYDGTTWVEVLPTARPPARVFHSMVFDSARGVVIVRGGILHAFVDTWEYDGSGWTERLLSVSPPYYRGLSLAYDSARRVVVQYGARDPADGEPAASTWEYDGTVWRQVVFTTRPPPDTGTAMVYDAARGVVVLHGTAGTWEYRAR